MFNIIWLEKNWMRLVWIANGVLAVMVFSLSWYDIYKVQINESINFVHYIQVFLLIASVWALANESKVTSILRQKAIRHDLFQSISKGDLALFKAVLRDKPDFVRTTLSDGYSPMLMAAQLGRSDFMAVLLEHAGAHLPIEEQLFWALMFAARSGSQETYQVLRAKIDDHVFKRMVLAHKGELLFALYEGDFEKVKSLATRGNVNQYDQKRLSPLHMAVLGKRDRRTIELLIELGADPNLLAPMALMHKGNPLIEEQGISPSMLAILLRDVELALFFLSRDTDIKAEKGDKDHVMMACELGVVDFVDSIIDHYDWSRTDRRGKTAIDYARQVGNLALVNRITQHLNSAKQKKSTGAVSSSAQRSDAGPAKLSHSEYSVDDIETQVAMSLEGMIGVENFIKDLSHVIHDFLKKKPGESKGIVVWGDASVGKTEFGQRLAGLKQSFNVPGLNLDGVSIKYIACCDGQIDIAKEVAEAQPKSVIILDEIDKFFSAKSGIVDEAQAKKLRTSIVTNFQSKPIFWIFSGTFLDLRGEARLTEKDLIKVLGTELTSRLDFADWQLPSWTIESLLQAAQHFLNRDEQNVRYDDEGIVILVQQALSSGGGVRSLQNYHDNLKRIVTRRGGDPLVLKTDIQNYLQKLNSAA